MSDNQPSSESEVEVKKWMEKALDIKDYRGGRGDRIAMLKVLINDGELGKVTQRNDVYKMALALARNLWYSMPPGYGKSWERHFAEQIANELGIEVRIIRGSVVVKPESKSDESVAERWNDVGISQRERWADEAGVLNAWRYSRLFWNDVPPAVQALLRKHGIPEWLQPDQSKMYYTKPLIPSPAQVKFTAPSPKRGKPQILGYEEKPAKKVERKVEPGLARFGVHKPEEPPLDVYLQKIEFEKRKRELEGK